MNVLRILLMSFASVLGATACQAGSYYMSGGAQGSSKLSSSDSHQYLSSSSSSSSSGTQYYRLRIEYNPPGSPNRHYLRGYDADGPNANGYQNVRMDPAANSSTREWQLIDLGTGYYNLRVKYDPPGSPNRHYLRGYDPNGTNANGYENVMMDPANDSDTRRWEKINATGEYRYLRVKYNPPGSPNRHYLRGYDENGPKTNKFENVMMHPTNNSPTRRFDFEPL